MIINARSHLLTITVAVAAVIAAVMPCAASAHMLWNTHEFYGAAADPWVFLESSLLLIAVCLWLVQWIPLGEIKPFIAFSAALIVGSGAGALLHLHLPLTAPGYAMAMLAGLLVAGNVKIGRRASLASVLIFCFYAGLNAGSDAAVDVRDPFIFISGVTLSATVIPILITGLLVDRKSPLVNVGIRIVGSWVAAIGLMLVAFTVRKTFHGAI